MKFIVDANIVFSGVLNTNGRIGSLLITPPRGFHFIAPNFLRQEIGKHYPKLIKISGLPEPQVREAEFHICRHIDFINEEQIKPEHWIAAEKLVSDIDPDDTPYVAYAKQFRCRIWSGDKVLMRGLAKKGFNRMVSTEELYKIVAER